jgi:hypothetical protein
MDWKKIADEVIDLFRESTITQSALTMTLVAVASDLWLHGQQLPEDLRTALFIAIGFFFGGKYQQLVHKGQQK